MAKSGSGPRPGLYAGVACSVNELEYFEARGVDLFVFSNFYDRGLSDSKLSGIEIIHHGVRTATNGDVRLSPTPAQWDPFPASMGRAVDREKGRIAVSLSYPDNGLDYVVTVEAKTGGNDPAFVLCVKLENPLPPELEGRAGFNLEFLPSAYFGKTYMMDGISGAIPRCPGGPMTMDASGAVEPEPIASGTRLVLAPEDPFRRISIESTVGGLSLFDGRNKAQNGWFVARSLIPAGRSGTVMEWSLSLSAIADWTRAPVIGHSQAGYHPGQKKIAVIELDKNDTPQASARILKVAEDGGWSQVYRDAMSKWGKYLRYNYILFDFSAVKTPGVYVIEYGNVRTEPFRIAADVFENAWQQTLDVFFPVQMDHMRVREAYRIWHGASHLDDALQAPLDHVHFDLYAQGPDTDTPYKPGERIPGLNVGGWFDAGDFDIRTQSQYAVVTNLVLCWENFRITRDQTAVDQKKRLVDIHVPDGKPDLLQQIEHGALALLAQFRAVGHAIPGIIESTLARYSHLGDASTQTDNLPYDPSLADGQSTGTASGTLDDRWAFTSRSSSLNYGSLAALAAAARALQGFNHALSQECLSTAERAWEEENGREPALFAHGNITGGRLESEALKAAVELVICTREKRYADRIEALWPVIQERFAENAVSAARAIPLMSRSFADGLKGLTEKYARELETLNGLNPYGVPITETGWAGNSAILSFCMTNYFLHKAFPDLIGPEAVLRGLAYLLGCHPGSDVSYVSGVGTRSKTVAYGNNRADFSFIPGGVVPGTLIVKPDFPENKEDWPFLWAENEYVITEAAAYLFLANAADEILNKTHLKQTPR